MEAEQKKWRVHFPGYDPGVRRDPAVFPRAVMQLDRADWDHPHFLGAFAKFRKAAPESWVSVGLDEAQVIVDPYQLDDMPGESERVENICSIAKRLALPCFFFCPSDRLIRVSPSYGTVFRCSASARQRGPRDQAMAPLSDDLLEDLDGEVPLREKSEVPVVGFCGNVSSSLSELVLLLVGKTWNVTGTRTRRRVIRALRRSRQIRTNFVLRRRFWGGALTKSSQNKQLQMQYRKEFVQSMLGADYSLCVRGGGNFSIRFYETLSAGRIPLFIDTDCVLPFDNEIDWRKHALVVDISSIERVGETLRSFHDALSPERYQQMQLDNRQLWLRYFEPTAYYRRVFQSFAPHAATANTRGRE